MGTYKKRAPAPKYVSPKQLSFEGFETPFERKLDGRNRWLTLAQKIPWDDIVPIYDRLFKSKEGRSPLSGRLVIGSLMVKHLGNWSDRETIAQIQENIYIQAFLGYSSFTFEAPFSASLFVEFRKRLSEELICKINDIIAMCAIKEEYENTSDYNKTESKGPESDSFVQNADSQNSEKTENDSEPISENQASEGVENKGKLLMDATVAPQNITYPTDLKLLNASREVAERLIDTIYNKKVHPFKKPRNYRKVARRDFLNVNKKKRKTQKQIRSGIKKQLGYLDRDLKHIENLLTYYQTPPLKFKDLKYLMVLHTVYDQQYEMFINNKRSIEHRIVNIHQPHVRPIVRGKEKAKTEFGAKLQMSLVDGFTFLDHSSWDAFNESTCLVDSVEKYKTKFGFYPAEVLADQIYCTRKNRKELKERKIKLIAKPLGRPSSTEAVDNHIRPGERNPIEGKFGQAKIRYGLDNIKARLPQTSTSWIATIALVLNLVRITRRAPLSLIIYIRRIINSIFSYIDDKLQFTFNLNMKLVFCR